MAENCDLCDQPITDNFVDGRTRMGPWACMCMQCHRKNGVGLGLGKGQLFVIQPDGTYKKVAG